MTLRDWLNTRQWIIQGSGEFCQPVSANSLLQFAPEPIWPGLMPPDLLPILGDDYGDWLCLRISPDDTVSEIVHWYHGGGDWIPWGKNLPEAILFQYARDRLSGLQHRHAVPAQPLRHSVTDDPHVAWAVPQLGANGERWVEIVDAAGDGQAIAVMEQLLELDIASVSLRAEVMLHHHQQQSWQSLLAHAQAVAQQRRDLAWPFHRIGWLAEQRQDWSIAWQAYKQALFASVFTEQAVRFRISLGEEIAEKYACNRMLSLADCQPALIQSLQDAAQVDAVTARPIEPSGYQYWQLYRGTSGKQRLDAIGRFWHDLAQQAAAVGDWGAAYDYWMHAGWDVGLPNLIDCGPLLKSLVTAAKNAGQLARAAVAQTHLNCFQRRFEIGKPGSR